MKNEDVAVSRPSRIEDARIDESVLRRFCEKESFNGKLDNPFSLGEFSYATNGHIAVRVPRLESVGEIERPADVERVFRSNAEALEGNMRVLRATVPPAERTACRCCDACNGEIEVYSLVRIGPRYFSAAYIRLMEGLPELVISDADGDCLAFRFAGGVGLLMKVKTHEGYTVLDVEL